jgi:hypothetical protein
VVTSGFVFLAIFLVIVAAAVLKLLKHFARRVCVLNNVGVLEAIREGYAIVRQNLKNVGLMWLIMIGIDVGWPILMIPVGLLLFAAGTLIGGLLALLVSVITGLFLAETGMWIATGVTGVAVLVLVLAVPLVFLDGLRMVFQSSTWTLTFRELRALESLEPAPVLDAPDTE